MIGRPEWFTYRIFGWGLRPKTWQGFAYTIAFVVLIGISAVLPIPSEYKIWLFWIIMVIGLADVLHIMLCLDKVHDEREKKHQLYIERNASYAAVLSIVALILFQVIFYPEKKMDYSLFVILGAMVLAKGLTTLYVRKKM